jgi:hypothetical protein
MSDRVSGLSDAHAAEARRVVLMGARLMLVHARHVATYIGGGLVFSHGGEGGPFKLGIDYRPDRCAIRRNI